MLNRGEDRYRFGVRLLSGRVKGTLVGLLPGTADEESARGRGLRTSSRLGRDVYIGS